ncbi:MAG: hypothetical protein Q7S96_01710 [bacterium]|nr:hypothetical protein [bacterium]
MHAEIQAILHILRSAWRVALRERRLWLYALFVGLAIGSGFASATLQVLGGDPTQQAAALVPLLQTEGGTTAAELWQTARTNGTAATGGLLAFGAAALALVGVFIWLIVLSTNALLLAGAALARGEKIPRDLRRRAHARSWPTLAILILFRIAGAAVLIAWGVILRYAIAVPTTAGTIAGVIGFIVAVLALTVLHLATPLALIETTVTRRRVGDAIRRTFAHLNAHRLLALKFSVALSAANILFLLVWSVGGLLVVLPFVFLGGVAVQTGTETLYIVAMISGLTVLTIVALTTAAIYVLFLTNAWTQFALRLNDDRTTDA